VRRGDVGGRALHGAAQVGSGARERLAARRDRHLERVERDTIVGACEVAECIVAAGADLAEDARHRAAHRVVGRRRAFEQSCAVGLGEVRDRAREADAQGATLMA
jgi:hypothetical protein